MNLSKFFIIAALFVLNSCTSTPSRNFEFTYKVSLSANDGNVLNVWIPIPKSNDLQWVSDLVIDTDIEYVVKTEPKYGNKYFYAHLVEGLTENEVIEIRFNLKRMQAASIKSSDANVDKYLQANRLVPLNGKFDSIVNVHHLSSERMDDVYHYLLNEMFYGKPKATDNSDLYYASLPNIIKSGITKDSVVALYQSTKDNNSEFTFGNGNSNYACDISVGNCTDFHSYFISLARTMKVPARFHIGFSIPETEFGEIGGYHCWASFLENNYWIPVDISEADKDSTKADFYYGNLDYNRVELTQGRDLLLEGYSKGPVNFFVYPIVESGDAPYVYEKSFSFKGI